MNTAVKPWRRSELLVLAAILLGVLHHVDHILRVDHSGWPFRPQVSPFTFSLLVYPLLLVGLLWRSRPWLRAACVSLVFLAVQFAHTFLETPAHQFGTWAHNASDELWAKNQPNLLHLHSTVLGYSAVVLSILLSVVLLSATISLILDARERTKA